MKAVLALQHGVVPQNLHFTRLPDDLARIETKLLCRKQSRRGRRTATTPGGRRCRRMGCPEPTCMPCWNRLPRLRQPLHKRGGSRIRDGGTAAVPAVIHVGRRTAPDRRPAGRLGGSARGRISALRDLAYTLARRRAHRPVRTVVMAGRPAGADRGVCARSPTATLRIRPRSARTTGDRCGCSPGRVRSGPAMGADLLATEPVFAATVARGRAADRPGVRVFGDRGDDGAARP